MAWYAIDELEYLGGHLSIALLLSERQLKVPKRFRDVEHHLVLA